MSKEWWSAVRVDFNIPSFNYAIYVSSIVLVMEQLWTNKQQNVIEPHIGN